MKSKILTINGTELYSELSVAEVQQYVRSGKTGVIDAYLDKAQAKPVKLAVHSIMLVATVDITFTP